MHFEVVTLFPEMFQGAFSKGVVGQALLDGKLTWNFINPRKFTNDVHKTIDDRPFGGGDGMLLLAGPLEAAIGEAKTNMGQKKFLTVYLSPQGQVLKDGIARNWSQDYQGLVIVCGRYGGVDERVIAAHVDVELSVGDYVLSGGEPAAFVLIDVLARFIPGVLGNSTSKDEESFSQGYFEAPQYTRPRQFNGMEVPRVLLSGDHQGIARWRRQVGLLRTHFRRPDVFAGLVTQDQGWDAKEWQQSKQLYSEMSAEERQVCGLPAEGEI